MILTTAYLWACTTGEIPFHTDIMFGTAVADLLIAMAISDITFVELTKG